MNNNRLVMVILILVLVLVGGGWLATSKGWIPGFNKDSQKTASPSDWHAIFLSNGPVYFGKLSDPNGQYITLKDIYYLQVNQQTEQQKTQEQPQISLVKLGEEIHGPVDEMQINRDHILFIERMKSNSKVVEAIDRYKKEGPTTSQTPAASLTSPVPSPSASSALE